MKTYLYILEMKKVVELNKFIAINRDLLPSDFEVTIDSLKPNEGAEFETNIRRPITFIKLEK